MAERRGNKRTYIQISSSSSGDEEEEEEEEERSESQSEYAGHDDDECVEISILLLPCTCRMQYIHLLLFNRAYLGKKICSEGERIQP